MKKILLALVALAVLAPAASGGGFATVGLSSLPADDLKAGGTWSVDLTVLQHGQTPLEGVQPTVTLRSDGGDIAGPFAATPTKQPGVYHAEVRFPSSGTWRYEVNDGFTQVHTFKPVEVGPASSPSSFPAVPVGGVALALLLAAALVLFLRRSRSAPQPAPLGR
jgi:YtkA-like